MLKEIRRNSLFSFFETNEFNEFVNFVGSKILSEEICLIQLSIKDGKSKSYTQIIFDDLESAAEDTIELLQKLESRQKSFYANFSFGIGTLDGENNLIGFSRNF